MNIVYIYLYGGLGNQLFIIFTGIAYAFKYNFNFKINSYKFMTSIVDGSPRPVYWNNFLDILTPFLYNYNENINYFFQENNNRFSPIPFFNSSFLLKNSSFQSYMYFHEFKQQIIDFLQIRKKQSILFNEFYYLFNNKKYIAIHFRIGDLKKLAFGEVLNIQYYINSLLYFKNNLLNFNDYNIIFFGEKIDHELILNKIKQINPSNNYIICDYDIPDWKQLLLISLCQHTIIANSTFSWWGAYLNQNEQQVVCYPSQWFRPDMTDDPQDIFPKNWIKIQCN